MKQKRFLILLSLAAPVLLLGAGPPAQAQDFRLQALDSPAIVVETGSVRFVSAVGAPVVGSPLLLQHARHARNATAPLETAADLPTSFALEANYPNPFNPTTTIPFALPEKTPVRLAVYDLLGRQVQVLVQETLPAGRHAVRFEASSLPSGVYFARIEAGSFSTVRRIMLIK